MSAGPFAVVAAVSALHDPAALRPLLESYLAPLRALGGIPWTPGAGAAPGPPAILVMTGGTEQAVLDAVAPGDAPLLIAHPGHNSLPAALEAAAALRRAGVRARLHVLQGPDDAAGFAALAADLRERRVRHALGRARIGLLGGASDWLVASRPAAEVVRATWGPTVVPLGLDALLRQPTPAEAAAGRALAREVRAGAAACAEPTLPDLEVAGAVHAALRRVVEAERLDAVAVRCFDLVAARGTTGCLALSRLADEGVVAGCEGDVVATLALLWVDRLLGATGWMANPSRIDAAAGRLVLAHCTVPRRAVGAYRLRSHFESGLGVALEGTWPDGPVTLVRIGGEGLERLWVAEGEARGGLAHPDLCRTQLDVAVGREALRALVEDPLGNHVVAVPGRHAGALRRWHAAMIGRGGSPSGPDG